ncbi:MAG: family 10 glycosylhydrolase [Chloroflexi bacterium]|nr:family 10 glycosylhydrolase [Chloroflexota bacterium]
MHLFGFDFRDPVFDVGGWKLSFQVITLENVYGLDSAAISVQEQGDRWRLDATRLSFAGQQQHAPGTVQVQITSGGGSRLHIQISATAPHKIRAIKLSLRGFPSLKLLDLLEQEPANDIVRQRYPNDLRIPLASARTSDGVTLVARCDDRQCRAKRFAVFTEPMGPLAGTMTLECIHEEDARHFDTQITVPEWVIDREPDLAAFREEYLGFAERELGLVPWDQRTDFPAWVRDIQLVLTLHGMHWSGYTFNSYDQMRDILRFVCQRIDGRHILAYLPGWEGRYYWQYGDYRPEPLLGGAEGFARLCDEARALGVHVMPMFGANCANAWFPNFHTFGPSSTMKSASRNVFLGNQPDWDNSRAQDTGWQAWLNPGAPAWQTELTRQILTLVDRYQFDAVFLDTVEVWTNDPDFNLREGYQQLVSRLRAGRPNLLITGEDWWDGLLSIFPIFQQSGHWRQVPAWVGRYVRLMGHICDSEPSRGSTGVFEAGTTPYQRLPDEARYIPTLAFVDGTLDQAQAEVETVIEIARQRVSGRT